MTSYSFVRITPPATEPVTLEEAKAHCRIGHDADDALLELWITAARQLIETETNCRLIEQTWRLELGGFPCGEIALPIQPVSSVSLLQYRDTAGTMQTLIEGTHFLASLGRMPPVVYSHPDRSGWPSVATGRLDAVKLEIVVGYGPNADDVPAAAKNAILLAVGYWDANRGDEETVGQKLGLPPGALRLLRMLNTRGYS